MSCGTGLVKTASRVARCRLFIGNDINNGITCQDHTRYAVTRAFGSCRSTSTPRCRSDRVRLLGLGTSCNRRRAETPGGPREVKAQKEGREFAPVVPPLVLQRRRSRRAKRLDTSDEIGGLFSPLSLRGRRLRILGLHLAVFSLLELALAAQPFVALGAILIVPLARDLARELAIAQTERQ